MPQFKIKILSKKTHPKESGIKIKRILYGKKIKKIKCPKMKKERKPIKNGKRNSNQPFPKQVKWKMTIKLPELNKVGSIEEKEDMAGKKTNPKAEVSEAET